MTTTISGTSGITFPDASAQAQAMYTPTNMLSYFSSTTWTPSVSGTYVVHVIGGGGGGASMSVAQASGGSAGGYARKKLTLSSSVTYTVTIGSGGAVGVAGGASS